MLTKGLAKANGDMRNDFPPRGNKASSSKVSAVFLRKSEPEGHLSLDVPSTLCLSLCLKVDPWKATTRLLERMTHNGRDRQRGTTDSDESLARLSRQMRFR